MKVLHVITSLRIGGAEKLLVDLLPELAKYGNIVDLCVFDGVETKFKTQIENSGIKVISLSTGKSVYRPWYIFKLAKLFRDYDIVHSHLFSPQFFSAVASCFLPTRLKFITTEHDANNRRRKKRLMKFFDKWMYFRYNHIICCGKQVENNLRDYLGSVKNSISTVNNGIRFNNFALAEKSTEIIENYKGKFIITMVASFRDQKDQPTAIRAISLLPYNYHLLLVGDGERRHEYESMIKTLGVEDKVHLLGIRSDVNEILKSSDIVVMSSHYEGLSLSSIEGMASGRPVVASDVDGLREVVDGVGVLFPHQDYEALASIIKELSINKNLSTEIGHKCQEVARQYDLSIMAKEYLAIYDGLFS